MYVDKKGGQARASTRTRVHTHTQQAMADEAMHTHHVSRHQHTQPLYMPNALSKCALSLQTLDGLFRCTLLLR